MYFLENNGKMHSTKPWYGSGLRQTTQIGYYLDLDLGRLSPTYRKHDNGAPSSCRNIHPLILYWCQRCRCPSGVEEFTWVPSPSSRSRKKKSTGSGIWRTWTPRLWFQSMLHASKWNLSPLLCIL